MTRHKTIEECAKHLFDLGYSEAITAIGALAQAETEAARQQQAPAPDDGCDGWEWAIEEIFGHTKHVGRTREVERFGTKMLRVDVPVYHGREEGDYWPRKIVDMRLDHWVTIFHGGASIFSFTLSDEATVMRLAQERAKIDPPARARLPAREPEDNEPAETDEHAGKEA